MDDPLADGFALAASTADLADEPLAREHAGLVEYRMDLAAAAGDDPLAALADYDGDLPLLVTNRPAWEGGEAEATGPDRLADLEAALAHDRVVGVDLELAALRRNERAVAVAEEADRLGVTVVASVHDFSGTPSERTLSALLSAACRAGGVGKLAVTADSRAETMRLLAATQAAVDAGRTVATMAMGEAGKHTRAVAPVYGSRIGYAPVRNEEATAPGQYDLATLSSLVETLR